MERARNKKKYILHKEISAFTCTKKKERKKKGISKKVQATHIYLPALVYLFLPF